MFHLKNLESPGCLTFFHHRRSWTPHRFQSHLWQNIYQNAWKNYGTQWVRLYCIFLQREQNEITIWSFKEFIQHSLSLDKIYYLVFEFTWANKLRWHYPSAVLYLLYVSWWFEYDYNSLKKVFCFMLTNKIVPSGSFEWGTLKWNLYQKANPSDFMGIKARLICIIYKNILNSPSLLHTLDMFCWN